MHDADALVPTREQIDDILTQRIAHYPDFPVPGVLFRDITPLLADADAFGAVIRYWATLLPENVEVIAGTEARGFMFGAALALQVGAGFVPVRKAGKLPGDPRTLEYELEYGSASIEIPETAIAPGSRTVIVDDLLATGGTAAATLRLVAEAGAEVLGASFLIELEGLGGRDVLGGVPLSTVWSIPD